MKKVMVLTTDGIWWMSRHETIQEVQMDVNIKAFTPVWYYTEEVEVNTRLVVAVKEQQLSGDAPAKYRTTVAVAHSPFVHYPASGIGASPDTGEMA
jgi:hypothetical protein